MEMGLVGGTELEVVRLAPLGDPVQISVLGYQLTIRGSEARRIRVAR
jgi:Fe2+ transport system protein FeoA